MYFGIVEKEELFEILGIEYEQNIVETLREEKTEKDVVLKGENFYMVTGVVDGDTFKVEYEGKIEKVRLIGVDTPESVHSNKEKNSEYGVEASDYTKSLIEGKQVILEFDVSQKDQYGRLLAYVYLENGEMLNKVLLEKGYAQVATYPPNVKYVEEFKEIQKQARENKVGFWSQNAF